MPSDTVVDASSVFDRALSIIEGELAVVFANADRVAAACDGLRVAAGSWTDPGHVERVAGLLTLVHTRTGPFLAPVLALLREAALAAVHPWPLLLGLLASRDEALCARTLEDATALAASGTLVLDLAHVQALAALGEREGSPLLGDACLPALAVLLRHWQPADARDREEPLRALLLDPDQAAVRRLAARVLDLTGKVPDAEVIGAVLAPADAATLSPALAYTRAMHLDLVELVSEPGAPSPIAAALRIACARCGEAVVNDLVGEFGWRRANLGLTVRPCVGVSVDGSLPFLLTPAEARLVDTLPGARRVFEQVLAIGHGGTVEAAGGGAVRDETVDRFRALNLAHAEVLGDILDIEPLNVARVETILRRMDTVVAEFASLFAARSEECAVLPGLYERLMARIRREMDGASPGRPLSMELTRLVQMFEDPPRLEAVQTLHGLKRYLHQRGLALGFALLEARQGTNRTVDLAVVSAGRVAGAVRRIEYVDVDPEPARAGEPPAIPYAVAVVVEAFARHLLHGETTLPRVQIYCYGNEIHYFVSFLNHPVFVRVDYSPPLGGGMIDLAYYGVSKYELDAHPGIGLEAIQAVFRRLDFQVEVDTTRIHARYDKERALDLADLCEKAETLFRLAPYLMDVDWLVGGLDLRTEARRAVAAAWADFFARWGVLPNRHVLTGDGRGLVRAREPRPEGVLEILWQGEGPYEDVLSGRPRRDWLAEAHAALARQGLEVPFVEQEREAGQIPLEHYLLRPLRAAVSRGALVEAPDGFRPAAPDRYRELHEADRFAMLLGAGDHEIARAARMARLATALERSLRFRTTGRVNGHEVQRAALALRDAAGALYALRDGAGIFRLAIFAPGGALSLHRDDPAAPWRDTASSDVEALAALLRRNDFLPSWIDVPASHAGEDARHVREIFAVPDPGGARRTLPGERVVPGARAAPGRGVGLARLGTQGRQAADLEGGVLFTMTLHPEDSVFLLHATAVVGTGGGILSHAGLMAVQFGRPALVVGGSWRDGSGGAGVLACRRTEFEEVERRVAGCLVTERRDLRECEEQIHDGDLVVVDADRGVLDVLGQSGPALALHDGLRSLEEANRRLASATTPLDVLAQRGHRLRARHQLERVLARLA
jgi:phosphohistidine swiveling domain-containing protein